MAASAAALAVSLACGGCCTDVPLERLHLFRAGSPAPAGVEFLPNGQRLLSVGAGEASVWRLSDGVRAPLPRLAERCLGSGGLSRDGSFALCACALSPSRPTADGSPRCSTANWLFGGSLNRAIESGRFWAYTGTERGEEWRCELGVGYSFLDAERRRLQYGRAGSERVRKSASDPMRPG